MHICWLVVGFVLFIVCSSFCLAFFVCFLVFIDCFVIARIISSIGCTLFVFSFFMVLCGVVLVGRMVIGFSVVVCAGLPERVSPPWCQFGFFVWGCHAVHRPVLS
jgi:hypothetical protein